MNRLSRFSTTFVISIAFSSVSVLGLPADARVVQRAPVVNNWAATPFEYVVVDQNIRDVLREVFAAAGVPVEISDAVRGQVHGRWPDKTVGEFMAHLSQAYGIEWYFDGAAVHISRASESDTKLLSLHGIGMNKLVASMNAVGSLDPRFTLRAGPAQDTVLVSGPPGFISTAKQSIDAIAGLSDGGAAASTKVTVYRGMESPNTTSFGDAQTSASSEK